MIAAVADTDPVAGPDRDELSLRALAHAYALAVDGRDAAALCELFLPDGTLTVLRGGVAIERYEGHANLPSLFAALAPYAQTLHGISAHRVTPASDTASGEVTGVAHHVDRNGVDIVLFGRYADDYARDETGRWRFAARRLTVLWSDRRVVSLS